jgi:DtxR family Mn-dependent transcriptional regulator
MITEKMEEYLEAIFKLSLENPRISPTRLAEYMGLTQPTVLDMLRRLEAEGYIRACPQDAGKGKKAGEGRRRRFFELTPKGLRAAKTLVRRHRLSERFLTDVLGMDWDAAHREACRLEHAISPEVEERLARMLGDPSTCPHGHPIPGADGKLPEEEDTKPLSEACPRERCRIARVEEKDLSFLQYLATLGLMPEVNLEVKEVAPFGGPILIQVGDSQYALGRDVASRIWTKPAGPGPGPRRHRRGPGRGA